jgi:toxin ParE1/3/4
VKPVRFHPAAALEIGEAADFYNTRSDGLGETLLDELSRVLERIQAHPRIGARYKRTRFRHCVLRRFPYIVFYVETQDVIWIAAFAHGRRKPGYWRRRTIKDHD